jgi:hypothetical protein
MGYLGTKPANSPLTSELIGDNTISTNDIIDGAVTGAKLENAGVTAGTYGSASAIPAVTVDAKGRVTSVTTNAVSGGVTSLNGQTGAITNTDYGAIGSYVIAGESSTPAATTRNLNVTVAGSVLTHSTYVGTGSNSISVGLNGTPQFSTTPSASLGLSGTWRRMTRSTNGSINTQNQTNLYVRIS